MGVVLSRTSAVRETCTGASEDAVRVGLGRRHLCARSEQQGCAQPLLTFLQGGNHFVVETKQGPRVPGEGMSQAPAQIPVGEGQRPVSPLGTTGPTH